MDVWVLFYKYVNLTFKVWLKLRKDYGHGVLSHITQCDRLTHYYLTFYKPQFI